MSDTDKAAPPAAGTVTFAELMTAIDTFGRRPDRLNRAAVESILRTALAEAAAPPAAQTWDERAAFEADAEPMGFDLTRQQLAVPEPWSEYRGADTGHRWGGWLARAALAQQAAPPAAPASRLLPSGITGAQAARAFEWLRTLASDADAPEEAGLALELWHAAARQAATPTPAEPAAWGVALCWSSSNPSEQMRCLADGEKEVREFEAHHSFIRWLHIEPPAMPAAPPAAQAGDALPEQASGQVYGIIDPDYGRVYTIIRKLAWEEGYAIGLHGSFTRDLDLIAVPWTEKPCEPEHLVRRILAATDMVSRHGNPGTKPQGRLVWTLLFKAFGDPRFVDLSIVPALAARGAQAEYTDAVGRAGQDYHARFPHAHPLPALWRWQELWDVMSRAALKGQPEGGAA